MSIQNFYPECYVKAGTDLFSLTTQQSLDTELVANWIKLGGMEAGGEMKEEPGQKKELLNGQMVVGSNIISGKLVLLEVTTDNYAWLRANIHKKKANIILNQSFGTTGFTSRAQSVYPVVTKEGKSGDFLKVNISFKTENGSAALEFKDMS